MKTLLIYLAVSYVIQIVLILVSVFFEKRQIKTLGELIKSAFELEAIVWIPVIGFVLNVLYVILVTCEPIWNRLSQIRLRR